MLIRRAELCRRCMWSVSRKTAGPLRRVVAADAFEDAGAVVEAVHAHVDARVVPVDELAVHPDLLGGLHRVSFGRLSADSSRAATRSAVRAPGQPLELAGREPRHVRGRAGADPDPRVLQERPLEQHARRPRGAGTARPRPARTRSRRAPRAACATRTLARTRRRGDLRLVGAPVARDERERRRSPSHDEHDRLDDLARARSRSPAPPPRAVGVPSGNSWIVASTAAARSSRGDALDRLGPHGAAATR